MKSILSAVAAVLVGALTLTSCLDKKRVAADYMARNGASLTNGDKDSDTADSTKGTDTTEDPSTDPSVDSGDETEEPTTPEPKDTAKEPSKPAETKTPAAELNFANVNNKILAQCVGCHNSKLTLGNVNIEDYAKVKAASAKIKSAALGSAATMPPSGPLPDADQKLLGDWIAAGSPEK